MTMNKASSATDTSDDLRAEYDLDYARLRAESPEPIRVHDERYGRRRHPGTRRRRSLQHIGIREPGSSVGDLGTPER